MSSLGAHERRYVLLRCGSKHIMARRTLPDQTTRLCRHIFVFTVNMYDVRSFSLRDASQLPFCVCFDMRVILSSKNTINRLGFVYCIHLNIGLSYKNSFEDAQTMRIFIILHMRKVSSGHLFSIEIFYSIQ